jgi:hypothetical protein
MFGEYYDDVAGRVFCVVGGEARCIDVCWFLGGVGLGVALAFHVLKEGGDWGWNIWSDHWDLRECVSVVICA